MSALAGSPQRLHRRRPGGAHLVMVLAAVLGLVLTLAVLRDEDGGRAIAVAARDLEAGTVLRPADVRFERVRAGDGFVGHLVDADDSAALRGRVLTVPLGVGDPVVAAHVRPRATADGRRAMSIPVDRARAVNGRLAPGDRVDVVMARDGAASVVAAGLEVLDVDDGEDGAFGARRGQVTVTLAVDVDGAQILTAALADGEFVLTRVTGSAPAAAALPALDAPAGTR